VTIDRGVEVGTLYYDRNEIAEVRLVGLTALMTEIKKNDHLYTHGSS
jgi:hypothetical protein